jgi:hypothetical protein
MSRNLHLHVDMRLKEAFQLILELERRLIANHLAWKGISLWPLIRHCLWIELLTDTAATPPPASTSVRTRRLRQLIRRGVRYLRGWADFKVPGRSDASQLFVSRPVYLQALPSGKLFDRIVDPLLFARSIGNHAEKYYVSPWPAQSVLQFGAQCLLATCTPMPQIAAQDRDSLTALALAAGLDAAPFLRRYAAALHAFCGWFQTGTRLFAGRPALRTMYLTSWYFPDMMGLTAAARQRGIHVVDVQHGKQGRHQAMYSGWYDIPPGAGYLPMPDSFWCWGQPSCRHILASAPDRQTHRPFVGGFPWLDYYRTQLVESCARLPSPADGMRVVLVTTQPRHNANPQPIPDFLLDYLCSRPLHTHFMFRCHPNDTLGPEYFRQRLADIPPALFSIDLGKSNLYDQLLGATHHITAYSSCCYEASAFGVPTLLFGLDARAIYDEEIDSGEFAWTEGSTADLSAWLAAPVPAGQQAATGGTYIESSLARAGELLAQGLFLKSTKP